MYYSTVTSKGTVTIPAKLRKQAGIKPTDRVTFVIKEDRLELEKIPNIGSAFGTLHNPKVKPLSTQEINKAVAKGMFANKK